jgi:GNAT superfamily N-acetyltransferase
MITTKIDVRPLTKEDLAGAERIVRLAFGTKLGHPDPENWNRGTSLKGRLLSEPSGVFGAFDGTELIGAVFAIAWGSFGFFGPLVVHPKFWNNGVAQRLLEPVMDFFKMNDVQHRALFTFADSTLHIGLYQKYGFWPRFLTGVLKKDLATQNGHEKGHNFTVQLLSKFNDIQKLQFLDHAGVLTSTIFDGLNVSKEITAVDRLSIGDTIILQRGDDLYGFAVCHTGIGSETELGSCYIKFAAVRSGSEAQAAFTSLLSAASDYAVSQKAQTLLAGTNLARSDAFRTMRTLGFTPINFGVAMHSPNEPAYDRPDVFIIDDWR